MMRREIFEIRMLGLSVRHIFIVAVFIYLYSGTMEFHSIIFTLLFLPYFLSAPYLF